MVDMGTPVRYIGNHTGLQLYKLTNKIMKFLTGHFNNLEQVCVDLVVSRMNIDYPGWWTLIETSTLDMESTNHCICGQLSKHGIQLGFGHVYEDIGIVENDNGKDCISFIAFANAWHHENDHEKLKRIWVDEIMKRKYVADRASKLTYNH